ncbi:MAG: hypothetical protein H6623_07840 [Bdellovibrionaceae bacterium]|nr:hypothetical protein [Pseudobdellovibrionaceae bacterium]
MLTARCFVVLLSLSAIQLACSKKSSPVAPEETIGSMRTLKSTAMMECPSISGTYACDGNESFNQYSISLEKNTANLTHFSITNTQEKSESDIFGKMVETLLLDEGGFVVNGQVQDKASIFREVLRGLLDQQVTEELRLGYVASCMKGQFQWHFVVGKEALKLFINKNADGSITQTLFHLDEKNDIKKEKGRCRRQLTPVTPSGSSNFTPPNQPTADNSTIDQKKQSVDIVSYPSSIAVRIMEKQGPSFSEPIFVRFKRHGLIFSRNIYTFDKSYIGPEDNTSLFWWMQGDDIIWDTPWKIISIDLKTKRVYGGLEAGEGQYIGDLLYNGIDFEVKLVVDYVVDRENQKISIQDKASTPLVQSKTTCPYVVKAANACEVYQGVYDTLSAFDYKTLGEAGPAVANEVVSLSTAFKLSKSVLTFDGELDEIRKDYLVPALGVIGQLKALGRMDQQDHATYVEKSKKVYANLIVTSVDTILKSQKLIPQVVEDNLKKTSLGFALQYIGLGSLGGDYLSKQPRWVSEMITPLVIKSTKRYGDLVFNFSQTSFDVRVREILSIEEDLKAVIRKICDSSPTDGKNDCLAALNQ